MLIKGHQIFTCADPPWNGPTSLLLCSLKETKYLPVLIPWNGLTSLLLCSLKESDINQCWIFVKIYGGYIGAECNQSCRTASQESMPGLLKSLKIPSLYWSPPGMGQGVQQYRKCSSTPLSAGPKSQLRRPLLPVFTDYLSSAPSPRVVKLISPFFDDSPKQDGKTLAFSPPFPAQGTAVENCTAYSLS